MKKLSNYSKERCVIDEELVKHLLGKISIR